MLTKQEVMDFLKDFPDDTPILIYAKTQKPSKFQMFLNKIFKKEDTREISLDYFYCSGRFGKDSSLPLFVISEIHKKNSCPLGFYIEPFEFTDLLKSLKNDSSFFSIKRKLIEDQISSIRKDPNLTSLGRQRKTKNFLKKNSKLIKVLNYCIEIEKSSEYKILIEHSKREHSKVIYFKELYS